MAGRTPIKNVLGLFKSLCCIFGVNQMKLSKEEIEKARKDIMRDCKKHGSKPYSKQELDMAAEAFAHTRKQLLERDPTRMTIAALRLLVAFKKK